MTSKELESIIAFIRSADEMLITNVPSNDTRLSEYLEHRDAMLQLADDWGYDRGMLRTARDNVIRICSVVAQRGTIKIRTCLSPAVEAAICDALDRGRPLRVISIEPANENGTVSELTLERSLA